MACRAAERLLPAGRSRPGFSHTHRPPPLAAVVFLLLLYLSVQTGLFWRVVRAFALFSMVAPLLAVPYVNYMHARAVQQQQQQFRQYQQEAMHQQRRRQGGFGAMDDLLRAFQQQQQQQRGQAQRGQAQGGQQQAWGGGRKGSADGSVIDVEWTTLDSD